ncbi:MAG: hypothetical protein KHZ29_09310 [Desulfovibrionaceae bacterium]|nr:hypothetical protein [Desulfovibrionaceae bacterium]
MYVAGAFSGDVSANYFADNKAGNHGGGLYVGGDFTGSLADYAFFIRNSAGYQTGVGIYLDNGGIVGTAFARNSALQGGGGAVYAGSVRNGIANVDFSENVAGLRGGGVYLGADGLSGGLVDSRFFSNQAGADSGGLYAGRDIAGGISGTDTTIKNGFFLNNYAEGKGGVFYIGTGGGSVSLTADADQRTSFLANADGTKLVLNNSFYIDSGLF